MWNTSTLVPVLLLVYWFHFTSIKVLHLSAAIQFSSFSIKYVCMRSQHPLSLMQGWCECGIITGRGNFYFLCMVCRCYVSYATPLVIILGYLTIIIVPIFKPGPWRSGNLSDPSFLLFLPWINFTIKRFCIFGLVLIFVYMRKLN